MYKNANKIIKGSHCDLGARIIYCRYAAFSPQSNALLFDLFFKRYNGTLITVRLCLYFPNRKDFMTYLDKFASEEPNESGRVQYVRKCEKQDVLIASDNWAFIDREKCNPSCRKRVCSNCYGMYQAVFTNPKQVYLMPDK